MPDALADDRRLDAEVLRQLVLITFAVADHYTNAPVDFGEALARTNA